MIALNCRYVENDPILHKCLLQKHLFPIGDNIGFIKNNAQLTLKYRTNDGRLIVDDKIKILSRKNFFFLKL